MGLPSHSNNSFALETSIFMLHYRTVMNVSIPITRGFRQFCAAGTNRCGFGRDVPRANTDIDVGMSDLVSGMGRGRICLASKA